MVRRNTGWRQDRFLDSIERGSNYGEACEYAGVNRSTPYRWVVTTHDFEARWAVCTELSQGPLVRKATELALGGDRRLLQFLIERGDRRLGAGEGGSDEPVITQLEIVGAEYGVGDEAPPFFEITEVTP